MSVSVRPPRLSVLLITYNHERHILQALKGLEIQRFEGAMELVVGDDSSTDGTLEILRRWAEANPDWAINILSSTRNLGTTKNYQRSFAACRGDYVAVLEGDDYWTSPYKLQRQFDFLDSHRECDLCSVNYYVFDESAANFRLRMPELSHDMVIGARELIADNVVGNFSTCMYRREALNRLPNDLFEERSYDWIVNICIGTQSLIGFLHEPMSVYRVHSTGVWSGTSELKKIKDQYAVLESYNRLTGGVFAEDFKDLAKRLEKRHSELLQESSLSPKMRSIRRLAGSFSPSVGYGLIPPLLRRLVGQLARKIRAWVS